MKMKYAMLTSAMLAVGMMGTASAGMMGPPPGDVSCGEEAQGCLNGDLVEVELKCTSDWDGGIYVGEYGYYGYDWDLYVYVDNGDAPDTVICGGMGTHSMAKTEGKCTEQPKGPTNDKSNSKHAGAGPTVEYEIKTVETNVYECQDMMSD